MSSPAQPVTLTAAQVADFRHKLSVLRHDINNALSLMTAAAELLRQKPQMAERMMVTLQEQPAKITSAIARFSGDFEQVFGGPLK